MGLSRPLAAVLICSASFVGAEPCAPSAHVHGDREAVARVDAELHKLGVAVDTVTAGCPAPLDAMVQLEGDGLAVAVSDAANRSEGRVVRDATVAAEWIDSWLHDTLEPWRELPGSAPAPAVRVALAPSETPPDVVVARVSTSHAPSLLDRVSVSADYEQSWTSDGTAWSGFDAAACLRLGDACLGLRGRYASQSITSGDTGASRSDVSVLATAAETFHAGAMRISPEVGVGVGVLSTTRVEPCAPPPPGCNPDEPNGSACDANGSGEGAGCAVGSAGPIYVGDHLAEMTIAPRASAALRIAVPLAAWVWLDGIAAATVTPFAHGDPFPAKNVPPGAEPGAVALPGEPWLAFQLAVGLRFEAPR